MSNRHLGHQPQLWPFRRCLNEGIANYLSGGRRSALITAFVAIVITVISLGEAVQIARISEDQRRFIDLGGQVVSFSGEIDPQSCSRLVDYDFVVGAAANTRSTDGGPFIEVSQSRLPTTKWTAGVSRLVKTESEALEVAAEGVYTPDSVAAEFDLRIGRRVEVIGDPIAQSAIAVGVGNFSRLGVEHGSGVHLIGWLGEDADECVVESAYGSEDLAAAIGPALLARRLGSDIAVIPRVPGTAVDRDFPAEYRSRSTRWLAPIGVVLFMILLSRVVFGRSSDTGVYYVSGAHHLSVASIRLGEVLAVLVSGAVLATISTTIGWLLIGIDGWWIVRYGSLPAMQFLGASLVTAVLLTQVPPRTNAADLVKRTD